MCGVDIVERRLLGALVLTLRNLANSQQLIKNKATVDAHGISFIFSCYTILQRQYLYFTHRIYTYRRGVCVARFD